MANLDAGHVLAARGITQRFGQRLVLDGVDLDVPSGQVIGLLGPNGAGKTTLMRIIFGVLRPDGGSVDWQGRPASAADRRSWGYMPQERGLYRDMRIGDHLVWLARLHGLDTETAKRRSSALLERLGLADRARSPVKELSGGVGQRVQLAAAMVHEPELLVLDEPFAGLDPTAVEFLSQVVTEQTAAGRHLVLSSHQLDLVEDVCSSITLLHHGRVVLSGEVAALKAASPHRFLRVDVAVDDAWLGRVPATVERRDANGTRLRLEPGADAAAVLDTVRAHVAVGDFGVDRPTLSELFLTATGASGDQVERLAGGADVEGARAGPPRLRRRGGAGAGSPRVNPEVRSTRLVVAREVREALRRKAPWITAAVVLLGSIALMVVPQLIGGGSDQRTVAVAGGPAPAFEEAVVVAGDALRVHVEIMAVDGDASARAAVVDDRADVAVVMGEPPVIIAESADEQVVTVVRQALAVDATTASLHGAGLDDAQIAAALHVPAPQVEEVGDDRGGRIAAATAVTLTVYLLLFMVTSQVANGVAIEKANRVSEVLLAIAPPRSLFAGKVIGVGLIGLLPLAAGALPVLVRLVAGGDLPPDTGAAVASGAAWFVLGAGFYLSAAGALGALVERQEEVGSAMAGLSVLLVGSYVIGQSAADSQLGLVLAILPFSSPMVEPARLALGVSSVAEVVVSLVVSVVSVVVMVRLAAAVYERAVVRTGRRLHLRDVLRPAAG